MYMQGRPQDARRGAARLARARDYYCCCCGCYCCCCCFYYYYY